MNNLSQYVNEAGAHQAIIAELQAAGFISAVWMIEDIRRAQDVLLQEKDAEIEGWQDECSSAEAEAESAFSELEDARQELEDARYRFENERDALSKTLDNVRACFDALKYHAGLDADQPELVALEEAFD